MRAAITAAMGLVAISIPSIAQNLEPRQVAAPASDIIAGIVRLPDPASVATASRAAVIPLSFQRTAGATWIAEATVPIERDGALTLALLAPEAGTWTIAVRAQSGDLRRIEETFELERTTAPAGDELPGWVVDRYELRNATAGECVLRIEAGRRPSEGWLIARGNSDVSIESYVTTQRLVDGEPIGLVARANRGSISSARVVVESLGDVVELALHDDGLHEDGARGDGLFGALVPAGTLGSVRARMEVRGTSSGGRAFLRSAQLSFSVLQPRVALDGTVRTTVLDDEHLEIALGALPLGPKLRLHVSGEVWGHDASGRSVPVCWLSRQIDPEERAGAWSLPLVLDARWLAYERVSAPLELRELRVQDPDTEIVFDHIERLAFDEPSLPVAATRPIRTATTEMLTGGTTFVPAGVQAPASPTLFAPALMLVHGYCSGGSVWPATDFTQPKLDFLDPNANRSHDQFAQLIAQRAQSAGLSSFGVVAHSQGGPASLHLLTYYSSGLDLAQGARRIQSVSSPYQGTPLASWGGFLCGVNDDMTPAGSATWLAGIPSWARAEVYTWTVADGGSRCNFLTSLLLSDPEDGTVEKVRSELAGGNNMGHTTGWCHTTGMTYPAVYTDHARNAAMSAAAAR